MMVNRAVSRAIEYRNGQVYVSESILYLCSSRQTITRLSDTAIYDELVDLQGPHDILGLLLRHVDVYTGDTQLVVVVMSEPTNLWPQIFETRQTRNTVQRGRPTLWSMGDATIPS